MIDQHDAEIGATVYLRPGTKTAPGVCYRRLAAVLVSVDKWPLVTVRVFESPDEPRGREIDLHRLNVGIRRKTAAKQKEGDGRTSAEPAAPVRILGRPHPPLALGGGEEEQMLF